MTRDKSNAGAIAENAMLRQQLIVLRRSIGRPRIHDVDRLLLLILARLSQRWRDALHLIGPETLLRWHRDLFKILWRRKSRPRAQTRRLALEFVTLIQVMARDNVLWGAERIRGEFLKLGLRVSKRTIQKYKRLARPPGKRGQTSYWASFASCAEHSNGKVSDVLRTSTASLRARLLGIEGYAGPR